MNHLSSDVNPNLFAFIIDRNNCKPLQEQIHKFCLLLTKLPNEDNLKSDVFICVTEMLDAAEANAFDRAIEYQTAVTADEQQAQDDFE